MVRKLFVRMAMVVGAVTWLALPAAAQSHGVMCQAPVAQGAVVKPIAGVASTTSRRDGNVTFTIRLLAGESTLRAEATGITFLKRLTADRVHVRIDVPGDSFELEAGATGAARVTRNGKSLTLQMTANGEAAKAERFAAGSKALAGFDALAAALESSTRPEAQSVLTSFALVHAVRGSGAPARALAKAANARQSVGAVRASVKSGEEMQDHCWNKYVNSVNQYSYEFDQCYRDYGWIPGMNAACAFEFSIKAELAWFAVISCAGGFPLP